MTAEEVKSFERCIAAGGVALFPADTVYGLATEPDSRSGVERLYRLKGRPAERPAAVMFFGIEPALAALPELGERTRAALGRLLPGAVTLVLPNPAGRFPLACGADAGVLGLRVPAWPPALAALAGVRWPVLQTSANAAGAPDARRLADVPEYMRMHTDLVLDGGELPGRPSTVVDLRAYEADEEWSVVREGAMSVTEVSARLESAP